MARSFARGLAAGIVALLGLAGCKFGDNSGGTTYDGGFDGVAPQGALLVGNSATTDFGTVNVGSKSATKTITVANVGSATTGSLAVGLSGGSAFVIDSDGCTEMSLSPTGTCSVSLHFAPSASGAQSASLRVSANPGGDVTVSLSGTGAGAGTLAIAPATHDYGSLMVGAASAPFTFTVTNTGKGASGAVSVALSGSDASQFALGADLCSGKTLAPMAACTVNVAANPTSPGSKAATLTAQAAGDSGTATASLSSNVLAGPTFVITPASYGFGMVVEGTPPGTGKTFTVENVGAEDAGLPSLAVTGPNAADFALSSNMCTTALGPMGTCTFAVTFAPTTSMGETATVTATAPGAMSGQTALSGTGLAPAALTITPSTEPFAPLGQGAMPSADVPFQVKNTGSVATGALAVSLGGTNADQFGLGMDGCSGQMLGAGGTCTVNAHFAPTLTGMPGGQQASLQVSGVPGGQTAATLTGTALVAQLAVTPTTQPLGSIGYGAASSDFPLMVSNTGGLATGTLSVALSGTMKSEFGVGVDGCTGTSLAKGASCTVYVHFAPTGLYRGDETATLTVSATPGGSVPVTLTGTALAPAQLALSGPTAPQWTNVGVGNNGGDVTFTVKNVGDQPSGTIGYNLTTGGSPFGFPRVPANTCTAALNPGASCSFDVYFVPATAAGLTTGTLSATATPGGTANATLEGSAQWVLEVSISADPSCAAPAGSVTSLPAGMNCAVPTTGTNTCLAQFADGTGVTLDFNVGSLTRVETPSCTVVAGVQPVQCAFTMNASNPNPFVTVSYCGLIM